MVWVTKGVPYGVQALALFTKNKVEEKTSKVIKIERIVFIFKF